MSKPTPVEGGRRTLPVRRNVALILWLGASQSVLLLAPPLAGWPSWLVSLPVLLTTTYWGLIHESLHGLLLPSPKTNALAGRVLSVLFGSPFRLLQAGHLLHHKFSRTGDVSEARQPGESSLRAALRHYGTILGGLYVSEVLGGLIMLLPARPRNALFHRFVPDNALGERFRAWMMRPDVVREARVDAALIILWLSVAGYAWGTNWPWLLTAFLCRGMLISFFDNAYHYGTPVGDSRLARNHALPRWASTAILHFNCHGSHHRRPAVPWTQLPRVAAEEGAPWEGGYLGQALRQLHGPIDLEDLPRAQNSEFGVKA